MMKLADPWFKLKKHPKQSAALRSKARFIMLPCGRGSGKTELARRRLVMALPKKQPWPDPIYFYALPTYAQARRVAWEPLKKLIPDHWVESVSESRMEVKTIFGSTLYVVGLDKPQRIEGNQWDGGVVDESCDQKPKHFEKTIRPALTHKKGWCWRIGVPKRFGPGATDFREACKRGETDLTLEYATFAWPSRDILPPEEIQSARESMDILDFQEQFEASWASSSGAVFHAFDESIHVISHQEPDFDRPILVGQDFNVNPMSWVLCQSQHQQLYVFDELFIRNTNTQRSLDVLFEKYGDKFKSWEFYGDASGKANKTSASSSDVAQIRNDKRFPNKRVYYNKRNPPIADRFASTNAMLKNAAGIVRTRISDQCQKLITDLNVRAYKPGTRQVADTGDIGHMTDGLGYLVHKKWPVRYKTKGTTGVAS